MDITRSLFDLQRHRRFGNANPERMQLEYWDWLVRNSLNPYQALKRFGGGLDLANGPDWCFAQRFGMSSTALTDGRTIHIGGEYEDSNDAEFCIYNDVVVRGPGDAVAIYGYPRHVFPPTDFHTATLLDGRIILIGCLGYMEDRVRGVTPVFALDTRSYRIDRLPTAGESPGWIHEHLARLEMGRGVIVVGGGEVMSETDNGSFRRNSEEFELDLRTWKWQRVDRATEREQTKGAIKRDRPAL